MGTSELLRLDYGVVPSEAFIIDARRIPEFTRVAALDASRWGIGVFAPLAAVRGEPDLERLLLGETTVPLFRLLGLDAKVSIATPGTTRTVALGSIYAETGLRIEPHEAPVELEVAKAPRGLAFVERRHVTTDAQCSYDLRLAVCLRVGILRRIEAIRTAVSLDGGPPRAATLAEERLAGRRLGEDGSEVAVFGEAARLAAEAVAAADAKSSAVARALPPLMFSALKEAYQQARGSLGSRP